MFLCNMRVEKLQVTINKSNKWRQKLRRDANQRTPRSEMIDSDSLKLNPYLSYRLNSMEWTKLKRMVPYL